MKHYLLLLLVTSLLHTTTSTVYYVMPDDHYHPINDNTYTLQHYLNNTNKYFTSNTQLHFLPGQYYLNNDLIIQGISNFSLIGNRTNEVINTVINCTSSAGIAVVDSSNIVITNIVTNECGNDHNFIRIHDNSITRRCLISLFVFNCNSFICTYFHSFSHHKPSGLVLSNVRENTMLENISASHLLVHHTENSIESTSAILPTHFLSVDNFQIYHEIQDMHAIEIKHTNVSYRVKITNVIFSTILALYINCIDCSSHSTTISKCDFVGQNADGSSTYEYHENECSGSGTIDIYNLNDASSRFVKIFGGYTYNKHYRHEQNQIELVHCSFINNSYPSTLIQIIKFVYAPYTHTTVAMINCTFHNNSYVQILSVAEYSDKRDLRILSAENFGDTVNRYNYTLFLLIENVTVSLHKEIEHGTMIFAYRTSLTINNVSLYHNKGIHYKYMIISARYCDLKFFNYNEFSENAFGLEAFSMFESLMFIQENSMLNFTSNNLTYVFNIKLNIQGIKMCPLQYISTRGNLDTEFQMGIKLNFSIKFNNNHLLAISNTDLIHCHWHPSSAFQVSSPLHVNRIFIINDNPLTMQHKKEICLCTNKSVSCYLEEMGPIYPGQILSFQIISTAFLTRAVFIEISSDPYIACKSTKSSGIIQLDSKNCTNINYLIKHPNGRWCELSLQVEVADLFALPTFNRKWIQMYTITLKPCPMGFSLHLEGDCQCDTILSSYIPSLTHCNIDDQTIPRPANSWISAHTVNNSHSYHVSLHCPFDYCLPHSSHLNLSTPDSQCQFNRSGLLCGQCQQGLSAVFGSSQCKQCSNVYLLIIIPIGIAGVVLVILLFVLNLTVTDGNINGFLLYVNIININASIFFPTDKSVGFTFISLANLNLGIETCLYDGMDEYAKMWLQLAFPIYLISIAILLIIASHYSARVQRLTARRALPVLATLFLLSYTKVLLTVSEALFFYSTITNLPSNDTRLVWSVDANVSLFGVKFTVLFTVCLLLFLALIPLNMLLIFTRPLSRFGVINYFKPILDAYQGPYKIKFYYWTGLQLLIRAVFFGLSALDKKIYLMLSVILLGAFIWLSEKFVPFKSKTNTVMETLFLSNLFVIFAISNDVISSFTYSIMINVLISLAMLQLLCVVVLHFKILTFETSLKCGTILDFSKLTFRIGNCLSVFRKPETLRCDLELASPVPEAYNYEDFQEPIIAIGQD